jgi:thiosulfate reductase cytochrome b subunit
MAEAVQISTVSTERHAMGKPRHSVVVRVTHWINTVAFLSLIISGIAILIAHPRLYWGETGGFGSPALLELPLPLNLDQSGWGRSLHFLAAWICILNGMWYVIAGLASKHFRTEMRATYTRRQHITYVAVIFALFPVMILTGLAMSPAVMAAAPVIVYIFGGHQSARTIHFFVASILVLFLIAHIAMVWMSGFAERTRAMITGFMIPQGARDE